MSIPYPSVLRARCGCTAPIFCATKTEMDCIKADGTSMINPHSFSATPTPAEAITPIAFTMAIRTRKKMLTRTSCNATGMPSFRIRRFLSHILTDQNRNSHSKSADQNGHRLHELTAGRYGRYICRTGILAYDQQIYRAIHRLQKQRGKHRQRKTNQRQHNRSLRKILCFLHFPSPFLS